MLMKAWMMIAALAVATGLMAQRHRWLSRKGSVRKPDGGWTLVADLFPALQLCEAC